MASNASRVPGIIGESHARPDAYGKVDGSTRYPADLIDAGMLHAKVVFSHVARARVRSIDPTEALALPGVIAVLTADNVPFNRFGLVEADQPVLCPVGDEVRFVGDKVAVVVADSPDAAERGARAVRVDLEELAAVSDPELALLSGSDRVHAEKPFNLLLHVPIRKGNAEAAIASADIVIEGEFSTTWQEHAFLQPEAGTAWVDEQGCVIVETAGQWLHEDRRQLAAMLELPEERVVVRYNAIGGAFGGREDLSIQHVLALSAWHMRDRFPGRKVALQWSREESIAGHHKRHPMRISTSWAAMNDGRIVGVKSRVLADGGAYASTSVEVLKIATVLSSGCYSIPNVQSDGYVVYTNNVPSGAFRGFGAPQAQFAAESMVNRLAERLGIDPIEIRRRNLYREGDIEPTGYELPPGVSALPVLDAMAEAARPVAEPTAPHIRRGVGYASGFKNVGYSFGFPDKASATVELFGRGEVERATVRVGAADVGQGSHVAMRQIASAVLGLEPGRIELVTDDSSEAPNAGSASASRLTLLAGRAVHDAAIQALETYRNSEDQHVVATVEFRPPATTPLDPVDGRGRPNFCYGYAAQSVEVEVNEITGQVRIVRVVSAHDVGRAINRQQVEGQIEGCIAQALGYALMEHFQMREGKVQTQYLSTYLVPTILDMPDEIVPVVLELADSNGPFGARGVAEMPLIPFAPAVAAAIHDACGIWLSDLPLVPERVLDALMSRPD
jgi:CO/xanthine dehydrogenase Mo-binding subunit